MSENVNPTCPTDCNSVLPSMHYDYCKPTLNFGEIEMLYITSNNSECMSDWTSPVEWLSRISDTAVGVDTIRRAACIGDMPAASNEEIPLSLGRKVWSPKTFTLNITIDDTDPLNYELMRYLECQTQVKIWFKAGNLMFGGNCAIPASINANYVIQRGRKTLHSIEVIATWEADFHPQQCTSPI